jgi:hypothetical protein
MSHFSSFHLFSVPHCSFQCLSVSHYFSGSVFQFHAPETAALLFQCLIVLFSASVFQWFILIVRSGKVAGDYVNHAFLCRFYPAIQAPARRLIPQKWKNAVHNSSSINLRTLNPPLTRRVRAPLLPLTLFSPQNPPHESLVSTYFYAILRTDVLQLLSQQLPRSLPTKYRLAFLRMSQSALGNCVS